MTDSKVAERVGPKTKLSILDGKAGWIECCDPKGAGGWLREHDDPRLARALRKGRGAGRGRAQRASESLSSFESLMLSRLADIGPSRGSRARYEQLLELGRSLIAMADAADRYLDGDPVGEMTFARMGEALMYRSPTQALSGQLPVLEQPGFSAPIDLPGRRWNAFSPCLGEAFGWGRLLVAFDALARQLGGEDGAPALRDEMLTGLAPYYVAFEQLEGLRKAALDVGRAEPATGRSFAAQFSIATTVPFGGGHPAMSFPEGLTDTPATSKPDREDR